jgi:Kef-type K+ transport system membrane component KefB
MFLAGLEIDLHRFASIRKRSIAFGLLTFAIPQGLGTLVGYYVLSLDLSASVLLASMFASHTLLAYPIASRLGIVRNEPVAVAVGATIITNTLALLVLAVVADAAKGARIDPWFWVAIGLGMVALWSAAWLGVPWLARWFFSNVTERGGAQFLFVLATVCGCAYLSYYAKMQPIIGAFLAGAAYNRLIPRQSGLMNRLEFAGNSLFIPFFLISVGMLVDPGATARDLRSWFVAGSMVLTVLVTKWMAARLATAWFGYRREEGHVMFGLSVVQAAATLAAVVVGYELHIFDKSVLNGAIAMIFVTCPLGAWVVDRYGRRMAARAAARVLQPEPEQRLLVAVANFESATRLLDLAFLLRNPDLPGGIHPITIVRDDAETGPAVREAENLLARCLSHAASAEIPISAGVRVGINVSDGIIRTAKELRAEAVLVGWGEERTTSSRIFGTVLEKLLEECPPRLILCRLLPPLNTTGRLFLPLPPVSERRGDFPLMLREVRRLAKAIGAELHVYLSDPALERKLADVLQETRSSVPTSVEAAADWNEARSRLFGRVRPNDMAVLLLERRQSPLWSPALGHLFEEMASRFPDVNLLAFYPALSEEDGLSTAIVDRAAFAIFASEHRSAAGGVEETIREMVRNVPGWTTQQQESVRSRLADSARTHPVELVPGILLLHTHSDAIETTTILVGAGNWAWALPGCAAPARLILALVSSREQSPGRHLRILSSLARALRDSTVRKSIDSGLSAADMAAALRNYLGAGSD